MSINYSKNEEKKEYFTQIIHLNITKNKKNKEVKGINKNIDIAYKINKMSYLDVKKKTYINFGYGKISLKSNNNTDLINIFFHDSSLQLRFQGFISIKLSSLSLDISKKYCIKINKIIGLIYNMNNLTDEEPEKILTDIYLYFQNQNDMNCFFDSLIHI